MNSSKYNYSGALEPINVKVVKFRNMPDFVFSISQWEQEGGWKGLLKCGAFPLRKVEKVITGTMNPVTFDELVVWEG